MQFWNIAYFIHTHNYGLSTFRSNCKHFWVFRTETMPWIIVTGVRKLLIYVFFLKLCARQMCRSSQSNNEHCTLPFNAMSDDVTGSILYVWNITELNANVNLKISVSRVLPSLMTVIVDTLRARSTDWVPLLERSCTRREGRRNCLLSRHQLVSTLLCSWHWLLGLVLVLTHTGFPQLSGLRVVICSFISLHHHN